MTLYLEELKAMMRGRFAWLGAAVVLLAIGVLATVGTQDTWLDGYGIIAYCIVPMAFIPLAAGTIASPRANRFVESVFTAPVERSDWLAAKIGVIFTLAAAYYVALVPMMLVYGFNVGYPLLLKEFVIWCAGILVISIAIGTLVGVLFIGRSVAAPLATGMGVLLFYGGLLPLQELMVARSSGDSHTGHLTLASPPALLKNALGFTLVARSIPATTRMTWVSIAVLTFGSLLLAAWIFIRTQGVETWETTRAQRWGIAVAILILFLFPVVFADTNYDERAPRANTAPAIRALFARTGGSLAMAPPGGQPPKRCCGTILNWDMWPPFGTNEQTKQDLLVLLPVDVKQPVRDLRIEVAGEGGLIVQADPNALAHAGDHLETREYPKDLGPAAADGHHVLTGWVARVPVTLNPTKPWDIGGDRYPLSVKATYRVAGEKEPRTFSARGAIDAQVAAGIYEMGAASLIFPLLCFGAAIARWRRTR